MASVYNSLYADILKLDPFFSDDGKIIIMAGDNKLFQNNYY